LNSIHNAILKFKNYITQVVASIVNTLNEPLPILFHDPAGHFWQNGSSLLKTFQSLGMILVYLGFEIAPEKKIAWGKIWRTQRPPSVTTQGDNMPRKHLSENSEETMRCVDCCTILLKPHIFCSMFIEKIIQFRLEKVL
jgi:hypothetical protein